MNTARDNLPNYKQITRHTQKIRPILFLDIDDVVINSAEAIIEILNSRFNMSLSVSNMTEWDFSNILKDINAHIIRESEIKAQINLTDNDLPLTREYILDIFETSEFWDVVQFKEGFKELFDNLQNKYYIIFITQGTKGNLLRKKIWLQDNLDIYFREDKSKNYEYLGIALTEDKNEVIHNELINILKELQEVQKGEIYNFPFTVIVDDRQANLQNNCDLKILLKNRETAYNRIVESREDLYITSDLISIYEILDFYSKYDYEQLREIMPENKIVKFFKNILKGERKDG